MNIDEKIKKIVYYRKRQEFEKYFINIVNNAVIEYRTATGLINYLQSLPYFSVDKIEGWNAIEITYTIEGLYMLKYQISLGDLLPIKFNP